MAVKGMLYVTERPNGDLEVSGVSSSSGRFLGVISKRGKLWSANDKEYPTQDKAILALARGRNREFSPRATFHQSRIIREEEQI